MCGVPCGAGQDVLLSQAPAAPCSSTSYYYSKQALALHRKESSDITYERAAIRLMQTR